MTLMDMIMAEHSKAQTTRIVNWIGSNQQRFDQLFNLIISDDYIAAQRAAWPLSYAVINHPSLLKKHFGKLIRNLNKPGIHDAVKRNSVRLLQDIEIPRRYHGLVMDCCFRFIASQDEKAAVKAFSLTILEKLAAIYPEILPELRTIIEDRWEYETAAFKVRARSILRN